MKNTPLVKSKSILQAMNKGLIRILEFFKNNERLEITLVSINIEQTSTS